MKLRCPKCRLENILVVARRSGVLGDILWSWLACLDCLYQWKSKSKIAASIGSTPAEEKEKIEAALKRKTTKKIEIFKEEIC